jgi:hypothetical protein
MLTAVVCSGRNRPGSPLGAASPLVQAEMRAALDAQNQPPFWFEARVVSRNHAVGLHR